MLAHFASCDECRSVYDAVADVQDEGVIAAPPIAPVVHGNFGTKAAVWTTVAAAAVAGLFFTPQVQDEVDRYRTGGVSRLVRAAGELKQREVYGRLSGFPYKQLKHRQRSGEGTGADGKWAIEAVDLGDHPTSSKELHAAGLKHLLLGNRTAAIKTLEAALKASREPNPALLNDLAAAHLDQGGERRALELAEKSLRLKKTPEALWNRALALQYLGRDKEADAAWQEYLKVDPSPEWAREIDEHHRLVLEP